MTNVPGKAEEFLRVRLREMRKKCGMTQEAFAERAHFSYKYYQGIERGQWTNLRLRTIEKLALGYGITLSELFGDQVPTPRISEISCLTDQPQKPRQKKLPAQ